jgi:hypothetical protein
MQPLLLNAPLPPPAESKIVVSGIQGLSFFFFFFSPSPSRRWWFLLSGAR